ncbi:MAG TPA: hypothetical protein VGC91_02680 [Pyrinomonadaceae bacterium]
MDEQRQSLAEEHSVWLAACREEAQLADWRSRHTQQAATEREQARMDAQVVWAV